MTALMDLELEKLIRLQRAESELKRAERELADVPRIKAELESWLLQERSRLDAARTTLEASQKSRRRLETELQDLETKRSRYKDQLMEVKTNKEYSAMLHEIEAVEREIRAREDQILNEMEKAESLAADVRREEGIYRESEERAKNDGHTLVERAQTLESELRRITSEREAATATVPQELLDLFQRVARLRGEAVGEARDGVCALCHVKLRLQMYVDLKRNESIIQCPACSRILYYVPSPPSVTPDA